MGFFIFGHGGSADHGCEDRIRGICNLLPEKPEICSDRPEEDWHYGLGTLAGLYRRGSVIGPREGDWRLDLRLTDREPEPGVKRIFWGSTVGPLDPKRLRQLSRYDLVAVSEPKSRDRLVGAGLSNVVPAPEPAFLVKRRRRPPAGVFYQDTVGLCLTCPPAAGTLLCRCYSHLIRSILRETNFHIALIPYSVRPGQNDLVLYQTLAAPHLDTGRIHIRADGNSPLLRGDLARCRCCVGDAGVLAAWSCGVPGLCLCATHRTVGLSQTLFGSAAGAVYPWEQLVRDDQLTQHFHRLLKKEDRQRECLMQRRYEI